MRCSSIAVWRDASVPIRPHRPETIKKAVEAASKHVQKVIVRGL